MAFRVRKILIVSDSHGKSENIKKAIDREKPDMLLHLGDIEADTEEVRRWLGEAIPAIFLRGNCDDYGNDNLRKTSVFELNGHRFYCTHGHSIGVSVGLGNLICCAIENKCDIALFGHTHVPVDVEAGAGQKYEENENDNVDEKYKEDENDNVDEEYKEDEDNKGISLRILNPGSISLPRGGSNRGYMVMTFDEEENYTVKRKDL